jgi:hypothetical protein
MKDLTIILPIHITNEQTDDLFKNAIKSITTQTVDEKPKLIVVRSNDIKLKNYLESFDFNGLDVEVIENVGDTSFMGQINFGVGKVNTKWFSVLEHDDEYATIWFKNVEKYSSHYEDVDVFLPLVVDVTAEGEFINFTNEAVWAMNFSDKMGYLDNECLLRYPNFQTSGMVINKEKFTEVGGFKGSVRLTFVYEFLLRGTYNDLKVFTIPKVGYKHTNMRPDSLFWNYKYKEGDLIDSTEANFWIETAKKEYFFTTDREIKYSPETV